VIDVLVLLLFRVSCSNNHSSRRMASAGMLRSVALVRTDVLEVLSASIIRLTRIDELRSRHWSLVMANFPISPFLSP
jgi:hypothetical protein